MPTWNPNRHPACPQGVGSTLLHTLATSPRQAWVCPSGLHGSPTVTPSHVRAWCGWGVHVAVPFLKGALAPWWCWPTCAKQPGWGGNQPPLLWCSRFQGLGPTWEVCHGWGNVGARLPLGNEACLAWLQYMGVPKTGHFWGGRLVRLAQVGSWRLGPWGSRSWVRGASLPTPRHTCLGGWVGKISARWHGAHTCQVPWAP